MKGNTFNWERDCGNVSPAEAAPAAAGVAKEPWQMIRDTFVNQPKKDVTLPKQIQNFLDRMKFDPEVGKQMSRTNLTPSQLRNLKDWLTTRATSQSYLRDLNINVTEGGFTIKRPYGDILILLRRDGEVITSVNVIQGHWENVKQALSMGKPVPAKVLADYPDLAAQAPSSGGRKSTLRHGTGSAPATLSWDSV